ncbi:hypothetical protein ACEPAF_63 [Sanghuangporus sanghuang]
MDAILRRSEPSSWNTFLTSPCLFLAQRIYEVVQKQSQSSPTRNRARVVCISDTHNQHESVAPLPNGDILIHAGDLTQSGSLQELEDALRWLSDQPHRHKLFIAGNHDAALANPDVVTHIRATYPDLVYLQDSEVAISINGRVLNIYGSPETPRYGPWRFQYPRVQVPQAASSNQWAAIPSNTDILITHGPPAYHLDNGSSGCPALLHALWRVRPRLHVFGHIHAARGVEIISWTLFQNAYERVCAQRGGWRDLLALIAYVMIDYAKGSRREFQTTLVNSSVVGGFRDELKRGAVVVDI